MKTMKIFATMTIMMVMGTATMFANTKANNKNDKYGRHPEVVNMHHGNTNVRGHATYRYEGHAHDNYKNHSHGWINGHDIRGFEGRVRFEHGIWSYYRNGRWYSYSRFINPREYYNNKLRHFDRYIVRHHHR